MDSEHPKYSDRFCCEALLHLGANQLGAATPVRPGMAKWQARARVNDLEQGYGAVIFFDGSGSGSLADPGGGRGKPPPPLAPDPTAAAMQISPPPQKKRPNESRARRLINRKWKTNKEILTLL